MVMEERGCRFPMDDDWECNKVGGFMGLGG